MPSLINLVKKAIFVAFLGLQMPLSEEISISVKVSGMSPPLSHSKVVVSATGAPEKKLDC